MEMSNFRTLMSRVIRVRSIVDYHHHDLLAPTATYYCTSKVVYLKQTAKARTTCCLTLPLDALPTPSVPHRTKATRLSSSHKCLHMSAINMLTDHFVVMSPFGRAATPSSVDQLYHGKIVATQNSFSLCSQSIASTTTIRIREYANAWPNWNDITNSSKMNVRGRILDVYGGRKSGWVTRYASGWVPRSISDYKGLLTQTPDLVPKIFSTLLARFMTTTATTPRRNITTENDSAMSSMDDEQRKLLANPQGNKQMKINACGKLYEELKITNPVLYSGAPSKRGIDFTVQYYDSLELIKSTTGREGGQRNNSPTVCLLHGAPGHYKDFTKLINGLTSRGVRVIAPNFPDYQATFDHSFRHSPRERVEYLLEFFKALNINKIDMVIGHSGAIYTILAFLDHVIENRQVEIKSVGLFSTPTYRLPRNLEVTPFRLFTLKLFDYPMLRPIITFLIQTFVRMQGIKNRVDKNKMDDFLIAASVVGYSNLNMMEKQMKLLVGLKLPVFLALGTNDRLISMRYFDQLKRDLGITTEQQVKFYNHDGSVQREIIESHPSVEVSQFDGGGHYAFQKFGCQVNEDVYKFLVRRVGIKSSEITKL